MGIIKTFHLMHDYLSKDDVGKVTSSNRVLDDVNLEIKKGSFVVLLGHNGSGKSTLARHFNAMLMPSEGTVWIDGNDTTDQKNLLEVRKSAGMIFQNPDNQIVASIVEEDVAFGPENIGLPTEEIWQRVADSLSHVGMSVYRYHSPNKLSGGQKQRVAIAGIMAMQPKCMILDEATAMLDPVGRKEVLAAVHMLNKQMGVTVIMITHYMEEAIDADRVIVLNHGKIALDAVPRDVFSQVEELKLLGLNVPPVTELAWELRKSGMPIEGTILTQDELIAEIQRIMALDTEESI